MLGLRMSSAVKVRVPDCRPGRLPDMELVGYLERWCLAPRSAGGNLYLHHIIAGDEAVMHDHPWDFQSEILEGGYFEMTCDGPVERRKGDVFSKRAEALHYIMTVRPGTWTRITTGPKTRDWGFVRGGVWVSHTAYGGRRMEAVFRNGYEEGSLAG